MKRAHSVLVGGLVALVVVPIPQGPASASCAGPSLEDAERLVLRRGGSASVEGRFFVDGCRDTMTCTGAFGCESCEYDEPPEEPQQDIRLRLRQQGRTWLLDSADAGRAADDRLGWVTWTFDVPAGIRPGPARLIADGAPPVGIRVD